LTVPNSPVEMAGDSIYYKVLNDMILKGGYSTNASDSHNISTVLNAKHQLGLPSQGDLTTGSANKFQFTEEENRIVIRNFNGLSEWQHFNGVHMAEGNSTLTAHSLGDKFSNNK